MKISFIIPVYCAAPFIHRCLDSIFALGIPEEQMEIICVDDCSPDNTCEVIERIRDERRNGLTGESCIVLLRHEKNKRQGGGSNTAIRYAHGDYAVFMDQDDEILPYDLLGQIAYMQEHDLDLLLGRVLCDDGKGNRRYWANVENESEIMSGPEFFRDRMINRVGFGTVWMGIYKMELLKRTEPFVEKMIYEDADWCFRCTYNAKRVQYKPFDMYLYYNNPTSSSHNVSVQKVEWKVRQSVRMYYWSQQVTEEVAAVRDASEFFYTWNMQGLKVLWKFTIAERSQFYSAFTKEEYAIIQSWPRTFKEVLLMQYPRLAQVGLAIVSPMLRLARRMKRT